MSTTQALLHLIGAVAALEALGLWLARVARWSEEKSRRQAMQDLSTALGIALSDIENPVHTGRIVDFLEKRFDPELLDNRLSDLLGTMQVYWKWAGYLLQYGLLLAVTWQAITHDKSVTVYAWLVLPIALVVSAFSMLISGLCRVATGRYPAQARRTRRNISRIRLPS